MNEQNNAPITFASLALALANDYETIYVINCENDSYVEYSPSGSDKELLIVSRGDDFYGDVPGNAHRLVYRDDQEFFINTFRKENVMQALAEGRAFSITYRLVIDGQPRYYFLKTIRSGDSTILVAVRNIDVQKRRQLEAEAEKATYSDIAMSLASRYEVIYHVNILTNEYREYSSSEKYQKLKVGSRGKDFFAETQRNMKHDIYPEDLTMMAKAMRKENLLKSLRSFGKTFLNYRLMLDGEPQYVSLYAVRPKEDSDHIIVAVANIDAEKRIELAYHDAMDMANRDALTGVKNKRAYVQTEMELDELISRAECSEFAIVVCDLNGLKAVNDTLGHTAGDDYIKTANSIICSTFKHSPVFRIGGDEFAVILRGQDYSSRAALMEELSAQVSSAGYGGIPILAGGMSVFNSETDMRVHDVFERADNLMYDNKKAIKSAMRGAPSDCSAGH